MLQVINDGIQATVEHAVAHFTKSGNLLDTGDLASAFHAARSAATAADQAFFHPSILALLYFPVDEMYAVFLPALLPMLVGVFTVFRDHRRAGQKMAAK